ncbi:pitrilysin family protein [Candidatus Methylospira mobilis]|uniref:M16 family metallopeptidase n=1 Tax=Candidatus Methylospira mobilis TaxID=1808979 RepID=UPI0028E2CE31|nr:pitrilysin family protein [Candidatus Methylospira mobilis]WNV03643.1 pitrilysin family protein [Candidatus Methylospira mobilis]
MFKPRSLYWFVSLVLSFDAGAVAAPVAETVLGNGLKIVVQEDHRSPVVVSQVWYKVGASYEYGGVTGVSHMLEHMMFKGTQKHPPGEFSRIISVNGGSENAFTGQDYTAYFQTLERSRLAISFELEADRMRNLRLLSEEYAKEHQVVLEERRMRTDDQPRARLAEHFDALAYFNSPYHNPVIGWPDDIGGLALDDLSGWYKQWYAPNNATLVVVGDVEPRAVFALAKKYFGALKPSKLLPAKPQGEVEQLGERRITVKVPAKLPFLVMGYKVPVLKGASEAWEPYAIEVLAGILDGGNSARLATHLVRGRQLASSVSAGYDPYSRLPSLFSLEGTAAEGKSLPELEKALLEEVRQLQETPVSQEELDRVKAQVLAGKVFERDSIFYQAMQLGVAETVGLGWQVIDQYVDKVNAVTADQIRQVAKKYLIPDRLSVGYLEPLPIPEGSAAPEDSAPLGGQHVR